VFLVDLPMRALFDRPTIAGMALAILEEQASMEQICRLLAHADR
jgi:hypothetical protein